MKNLELAPLGKKHDCVKFNVQWCNKFKLIQKSRKGKGFALCPVCGNDFSVAHGGEHDINRHKDTSKHNRYVDAAQKQRKLTDFGTNSATANFD